MEAVFISEKKICIA